LKNLFLIAAAGVTHPRMHLKIESGAGSPQSKGFAVFRNTAAEQTDFCCPGIVQYPPPALSIAGTIPSTFLILLMRCIISLMMNKCRPALFNAGRTNGAGKK